MKKASSDPLLLDLNVLLALAWPNHQFHQAATARMQASDVPWATCALTQLGFVRLSSNPAAIPTAKSPAEAALMLAAMTGDPLHFYIESLPSPIDKGGLVAFDRILGYKQITDAYPLGLARRRRATFLTFDARLKGLTGAETKLEILGI